MDSRVQTYNALILMRIVNFVNQILTRAHGLYRPSCLMNDVERHASLTRFCEQFFSIVPIWHMYLTQSRQSIPYRPSKGMLTFLPLAYRDVTTSPIPERPFGVSFAALPDGRFGHRWALKTRRSLGGIIGSNQNPRPPANSAAAGCNASGSGCRVRT